MHPVHAAKPIRISTHKIQKDKKEDRLKTNKLAISSMILTVAGFLTALIPSVAMLIPYIFTGGIVCGIIALLQIKKNKEKGKGMVIASIVLVGLTLLSVAAMSDIFSGFTFIW
jgi:4-hydroxybenzoate polyprenyltransferase